MRRNNKNANQKFKTHLDENLLEWINSKKKERWVNYSGVAETEITEYVGKWKSLKKNTKYFLFKDRKQWKNKRNERLLKTINVE